MRKIIMGVAVFSLVLIIYIIYTMSFLRRDANYIYNRIPILLDKKYYPLVEMSIEKLRKMNRMDLYYKSKIKLYDNLDKEDILMAIDSCLVISDSITKDETDFYLSKAYLYWDLKLANRIINKTDSVEYKNLICSIHDDLYGCFDYELIYLLMNQYIYFERASENLKPKIRENKAYTRLLILTSPQFPISDDIQTLEKEIEELENYRLKGIGYLTVYLPYIYRIKQIMQLIEVDSKEYCNFKKRLNILYIEYINLLENHSLKMKEDSLKNRIDKYYWPIIEAYSNHISLLAINDSLNYEYGLAIVNLVEETYGQSISTISNKFLYYFKKEDFDKSYELWSVYKYIETIFDGNLHMAIIFHERGDIENALIHLKKAEDMIKEKSDEDIFSFVTKEPYIRALQKLIELRNLGNTM